jgi:hypothetical protein
MDPGQEVPPSKTALSGRHFCRVLFDSPDWHLYIESFHPKRPFTDEQISLCPYEKVHGQNYVGSQHSTQRLTKQKRNVFFRQCLICFLLLP